METNYTTAASPPKEIGVSDILTTASCLIAIATGLYLWLKLTLAYTALPSDFIQDYLAGYALLNGLSIYGETIPELSIHMLGIKFHENFHPPFTALLFAPLALLDFSSAFIVWNTLSLVAYLFIVYIALDYTSLTRGQKKLLLSFSLLWYPFISDIGHGNSSSIIVLAISAGWLAMQKNKNSLAGALFGFACLIKLFPGLLLIFLLAQKNWRGATSMCFTILVGFLFSFLVLGSHDFIFYFTEVLARDVKEWGGFPTNISLTGLALPVLTENSWVNPLLHIPKESAVISLKVLSFGFIFYTSYRLFILSKNSLNRSFAFGLTCIAMVLASPISWSHILFIALLPMAILVSEKKSSINKIILFILIAFSIPDIELARFLHSTFSPQGVPWAVYLLSRFETYGLLVLWYLLAYPKVSSNNGYNNR